MRRLSSLLLNSNKIKARGAEALAAALRGNDSLTQLELGANRVRTRSGPLRSQSTSWCRWPVAAWADVGSVLGRCGHNSPLGAPSLAGESATAAASGAPTLTGRRSGHSDPCKSPPDVLRRPPCAVASMHERTCAAAGATARPRRRSIDAAGRRECACVRLGGWSQVESAGCEALALALRSHHALRLLNLGELRSDPSPT